MALKHVTEDWVSAAHTAGLKVAVYTVNEIDDIQRMNRWGVDAIFCDYPDRGFQALE
jgi:glycerophosphoryl diester phosphodiesterase